MNRLEGKVAFVTGGSRGIGAAVVRRLAKEGAHVAFTYSSSSSKAEETMKAAQKHSPNILALKADSADAGELRQAIDQVARKWGRIDILVNNAGTLLLGHVDDLVLADFDRGFAVNVRAIFIATQASLKHMKEGGRIINIGSCNAERMPFEGGAAYAMTKSALIGLTKGFARDLGKRAITVNTIQPGPVDTDMNPEQGEFAETLKNLMALPRYGTADEIAGMVAYLASQEAAYVTGSCLTIDGGFTA